MRTGFVHSHLVAKTVLLVLAVACAVGLVANAIVGRLAWRYEAVQAEARIRGLMAVVEPSVSVACFGRDKLIADQSARGLLTSPSIAAVEIRAQGELLAQARRPAAGAAAAPVTLPVASPFAKDEVVGEWSVYPDREELALSVAHHVWVQRASVLLLLAMLTTALALTVLRTIVRPIQGICKDLDALGGAEGARVPFPPGHRTDEIGRLVSGLNVAFSAADDRNRLEKELQEVQKLNSLGRLAAGVAHDLNNMLAGIVGSADLLLAGSGNPGDSKHLQTILAAGLRSGELVGKLLAFGRLGKNRTVAVDLNGVIRESLAIVRPAMAADLRVEPTLREGLHVDGDPSQIQQVMLNLLLNASEAMPQGGLLKVAAAVVELGEGEAAGQGLPPGPYVRVTVADTGPGIEKDIQGRIFEPFFSTKVREGRTGAGLGLPTVYGILQAHQGAIKVDSAPGRGATFTILLPQGRLPFAAAPAVAPAPPGKDLVLLVEDEPLIRETGREILENLGYSVATAQDGKVGVEAFRAHHAQLHAVLLDLKMPVMDGLEAFGVMRTIDPSVPVIVCTGYAENEDVQHILDGGGAGLLLKPYRVAKLAETLRGAGLRMT